MFQIIKLFLPLLVSYPSITYLNFSSTLVYVCYIDEILVDVFMFFYILITKPEK